MYNSDNKRAPRIGEVYLMKFSGSGSEQQGWRPGVVVQNNLGNIHSPNVIALPLTTALKKLNQPTHVLIKAEDSGLKYDSVVLCENPERMSKVNIDKYITKLSDEYMKKVAVGNLLATSVIAYLDIDVIMDIKGKAVALNNV